MNRQAVILFLLLLVGLTGWWLQQVDVEVSKKVTEARHDADYYMVNFTRTEMGLQGRPKNQLRAEYMQHFPDDDTMELVEPRLELYKQAGRTWYVSAEKGWATSNNEVVLLYGEVHIWQLDDTGARSLEVITWDLKVLPAEEYAETDKPATIISPGSVTDAVGMRVNMQKSKLELLSEVKTHYEPRQSH